MQTQIEACVSLCEALEISGAQAVLPLSAVDKQDLETYWNALENKDTLKYRWVDMFQPTANSIIEWLLEYKPEDYFEYLVVDCDTGEIISEFALTDFKGKSAQVHFSMKPGLDTKIAIQLADQVTDCILHNWSSVKDMEEAFIETIYGVTPTENRVACIFVLKAGFKKLGILPFGLDYMDKVSDAMISYKTRRN